MPVDGTWKLLPGRLHEQNCMRRGEGTREDPADEVPPGDAPRAQAGRVVDARTVACSEASVIGEQVVHSCECRATTAGYRSATSSLRMRVFGPTALHLVNTLSVPGLPKSRLLSFRPITANSTGD